MGLPTTVFDNDPNITIDDILEQLHVSVVMNQSSLAHYINALGELMQEYVDPDNIERWCADTHPLTVEDYVRALSDAAGAFEALEAMQCRLRRKMLLVISVDCNLLGGCTGPDCTGVPGLDPDEPCYY